MTRNNKTRHALLMSLMSILLCIAMLIGSTFAWFTDTASTNVGNIVSGTLDVDIVDEEGTTLVGDGKTLLFMQKANAATAAVGTADILWEPGATYQLTPFKIANKGDLALKYKVTINGITGDAKLLSAIEFTAKIGETEKAISDITGELLPGTEDSPNYSGIIAISGHMKENAGNEYQGLTLDGIGITVSATQMVSEYDSTRNDYDKDAVYPAVVNVTKDISASISGNAVKEGGVTIKADESAGDNATVKVTLPEGVKISEGSNVSISIVEAATPTDANIKVESSESATTLDINMTGVDFDNSYGSGSGVTPTVITYPIGTGLTITKLYHESNEMTLDANLDTADDYYYDKSTGVLSLAVTHLSPFTYVVAHDDYAAQLKIAEILAAQEANTDGAASMTVTIDGIEFYVLGKENGKALLLQKKVDSTIKYTYGSESTKMRFTYADNPTSAWKDSSVREYVNGEYLIGKTVLNSIIAESTIYTAHNRTDSETSYDATVDKVFILSEADVHGTANKVETTEPKEYTLASMKTLADDLKFDGDSYWYRSPGTQDSPSVDASGNPITVKKDAHIIYLYRNTTNHCVVAGKLMSNVRPAMWVKLAD